MKRETGVVAETNAPAGRPIERLDVGDLGPPKPLQRTLESLADLPDRTVLAQRNDRAPRFLYPKLGDRGYRYETVERDEGVWTVIWQSAEA